MGDAGNREGGELLELVRGEGEVVLLRLRIAGIVLDLVHRRNEELAGFRKHVEASVDRMDEGPSADVHAGRRIDDDDRAAFGF